MSIVKSRQLICLAALALLLCLVCASALAGPAYPGTVTLLDATGNELAVRTYGDEFFSYTATTEGEIVMRDGWDRFHYVVKDEDGYALGDPVFKDEEVRFFSRSITPEEQPDTRPRVTRDTAGDGFQENMEQLLSQQTSGVSLFALNRTNFSLNGYVPQDGVDPLYGKAIPLEGEDLPPSPEKGKVCPLLVLKVDYDDVKCVYSDAQWHDTIFGAEGVTGYYNEVSNGNFTYVPAKEAGGTADDGVVTVTLPFAHPAFENRSTGNNYEKGARADGYFSTDGTQQYAIYGNPSVYAYALEQASHVMDLSVYDTRNDEYYNGNNDGFVSPTELAVMVVHSGYEISFGLSDAGDPTTWASSWYANNWWVPDPSTGEDVGTYLGILLDGVMFYKYTIVGELLNGSPTATSYRAYDAYLTKQENEQLGYTPFHIEIGTICHELGHDLGLMDLYDTLYMPNQPREVSALSLMASGSWASTEAQTAQGRYGASPTHLDPFSKLLLGFYAEEEITQTGVYPLYQSSDSDKYRILSIPTDDEDIVYLAELRNFTGFDAGLYYMFYEPGGVVLWRIDFAVLSQTFSINRINTIPNHYGVMPVYLYYQYLPFFDLMYMLPFRNLEMNRYFEKEVVLTLPEKQDVSLWCFDETAPSMDLWIKSDTPIPLTFAPFDTFMEGEAADLTTVLGKGSKLAPSDLRSLTLGDHALSAPVEYDTEKGSIVLTLKKAYLNTLTPGTYALRATLTGGLTATAEISVLAKPPVTGDEATPLIWIGLIALCAVIVFFLCRKRRK